MLKELKKNKMSVVAIVATGILFGVMGVLIIPMIAVIVKISNALSQKHPRIYKYSMIAFIGMLLAISLFCVVIKHQMSFLVIVACLAITLCDTNSDFLNSTNRKSSNYFNFSFSQLHFQRVLHHLLSGLPVPAYPMETPE